MSRLILLALLGCATQDTAPPLIQLETPAGSLQGSWMEVDGWAVMGGDIMLGRADDIRRTTASNLASRAITVAGGADLWSNAIIPYSVDPAVLGTARIDAAIEILESMTPLRFVPRTSELDYVDIVDGSGCTSFVGRQGGRQELVLASACSLSATMHELLHAAGLYHEHARADRNSHIRMLNGCIDPAGSSRFEVETRSHRAEQPYDLKSLMHYSSTSFLDTSVPGCTATIVLQNGYGRIRNNSMPSAGDVAALVDLYNGHQWASFSLSANTEVARRGSSLELTIALPSQAPSRVDVLVATSDGSGRSVCPPILGGDCLDITGSLQTLGQVRTHNRVATMLVDVPDQQSDVVEYQAAIMLPRQAFLSSPVRLPVADVRVLDPAGPDFDNDGYGDLVFGCPGENWGDDDEGVFFTQYGDLAVNESRAMTANVEDFPGLHAPGAGLGAAFTTADFNGDGFDDLAVGAPGTALDPDFSGGVGVAYGDSAGLAGLVDTETFMPVGGALVNAPATGDPAAALGTALASGDFDGNGFSDLVMAAPGSGDVHVVFGDSRGLADLLLEVVSESDPCCSALSSTSFGSALAVADLDDDGRDDLIIGAPPSGVVVLPGASWGISRGGAYVIDASSLGTTGPLGDSLATGDLNGDGWADLAIGAPDATVDGSAQAGKVIVRYGGGPVVEVDQSHPAFAGSSVEAADRTGSTLDMGDLNGDGFDELIIGVPEEDWGSVADSGFVEVLYGRHAHDFQDGSHRSFETSTDALVGASLDVVDLDADGRAELIVGSPGRRSGAGTVWISPGVAGFTLSYGTRLDQNDLQIRTTHAENGDACGARWPYNP